MLKFEPLWVRTIWAWDHLQHHPTLELLASWIRMFNEMAQLNLKATMDLMVVEKILL